MYLSNLVMQLGGNVYRSEPAAVRPDQKFRNFPYFPGKKGKRVISLFPPVQFKPGKDRWGGWTPRYIILNVSPFFSDQSVFPEQRGIEIRCLGFRNCTDYCNMFPQSEDEKRHLELIFFYWNCLRSVPPGTRTPWKCPVSPRVFPNTFRFGKHPGYLATVCEW